MNCRAGAGRCSHHILDNPGSPTHLHLCAFAFAFTFCGRLPAIPYKRLSLFFFWVWVGVGFARRRRPWTASHLLLLFQACRECLLFCPNLPLSVSLSRSLFVLLREFITFRVLRLLSGVLLLSSHRPILAQLSSSLLSSFTLFSPLSLLLFLLLFI